MPFNDSDRLATAIVSLSDPNRRAELRGNSLAHSRATFTGAAMTAQNEEMNGEMPEFPTDDVDLAYERAGGDTWDDLLQYLESDPAEDFDDLSKHDLAKIADRVRELMENGTPYPGDADELRRVLESRREAA